MAILGQNLNPSWKKASSSNLYIQIQATRNYTTGFYLVQWPFQGTETKFPFCICIQPYDSRKYIPVYIPIPVYIFCRDNPTP